MIGERERPSVIATNRNSRKTSVSLALGLMAAIIRKALDGSRV
jgi:hypothetical protein